MSERKHRCGGDLHEASVKIRHDSVGFIIIQNVTGFVCDKCHEELIGHDTALALHGLTTPSIWFSSSRPTPATSEIEISLPATSSSYIPA